MRTNGSQLAADHSKGGGGVERGGDPCGRPAEHNRSLSSPIPCKGGILAGWEGGLLLVFGTLYFIFQYLH